MVGVTFADGRFREWPVSCVEVVRTEPDEIKVGDVVEEMPPKTSNVRGVMRVVIPMADRCNGRGVMVAELTPDTDITPAAVSGKAKYRVTEIEPSRWGE